MHHEEDNKPASPGFGINTGGFGLLLVAVCVLGLALICKELWAGGPREKQLYRWDENAQVVAHGEGHEAEPAEHHEAMTDPTRHEATGSDTTATAGHDSAAMAPAYDTAVPSHH